MMQTTETLLLVDGTASPCCTNVLACNPRIHGHDAVVYKMSNML